jgi:hypothetical protein
MGPGNHVPNDAAFEPASQDRIVHQGWTWGELKATARREIAPFKTAQRWTVAGIKEGTGRVVTGVVDGALGLFAAERGVLNHLRGRYKSEALDRLAGMLYRDLETGKYQGQNLPSAIKAHAHMMRNRLAKAIEKHGIGGKALDEDAERLLAFILTSQEEMSNADVQQLVTETKANVPAAMQRKLMGAALDIRKILADQFYYARAAGVDVGSTINGYLSRQPDLEAVWENPEKFRTQAAKVYGALFDQTVGTDSASFDEQEMRAVLRSMGFTYKATRNKKTGARRPASNGALTPTTAGMVRTLAQLQAQLRRVEKKLKKAEQAGGDTDELLAQIAELAELIDEQIDELLPELRREYAAKAAEDWRSRLAIGDMNDFDTTGPQSSFTNGRKLPPEADSLMVDFYRAPLDRVRDYLERSTRKSEYVRFFGEANNDQPGSKLEQLLRDAEKQGVTGDQIATIKGIVERATGRAKYSVPNSVTHATNWINTVGQVLLLPRALLASAAETVITPLRTGDVRDLARPFMAMAGQVMRTKDATKRREIAEVIGAIARPFDDDGMANRLSGDSFSAAQNRISTRFYENIGLSPYTRAQRTALVQSYHVYLTALAKRIQSRPTQVALEELGLPKAEQADFAKWILSFNGGMPDVAELIDPRTDRPGAEGAHYARMLLALIEGTVVEADKIDKPALSSNPAARLAWAITSFNYAHWAKVYKPLIRKTGRDVKTLAMGTNTRGESRLDAARSLINTAATMAALYGATYMLNMLREASFGDDKWDEKTELSKFQGVFDRMGGFGPLAPVVSAFMGIRFQRDITSIMAGPYLGTLLQNVQDVWKGYGLDPQNTREPTANDRVRAAKAVYMSTAAILAGVAAATLPGGPILGKVFGALDAWLSSSAGAKSAIGLAGYEKAPSKAKKKGPELTDENGKPVPTVPKKRSTKAAEKQLERV